MKCPTGCGRQQPVATTEIHCEGPVAGKQVAVPQIQSPRPATAEAAQPVSGGAVLQDE